MQRLLSSSSRRAALGLRQQQQQQMQQVQKAQVVQVRHSGHWLHKNIRAEENAGLREASYKTWEFDYTSIPRIVAYLLVPGLLFYTMAVEEAKQKDAQKLRNQTYGVMPPAPSPEGSVRR